MRACVVVFPGSNSDLELVHTLSGVCDAVTTVLWHADAALPAGTDLVAIPGGFSYGDYLRCGAIAKVSPIVPAIRAHAERGGFVLGICNGFQILTEVGLLPGALTRNLHMRFECRDVVIKAEAEGPFTPRKGQLLRLPIAHAEGRYQASDAILAELEREGRVAYRYVDAQGEVRPEANPNGSASNIAGIYGGPRKNILGLMPHPERMSEKVLGSGDGKALFDAVLAHVA